jgi:CheY-like chemotaxis protein
LIKLLKSADSGEEEPDEPFSVLVVDDELGLLTSLKRLLETHGYVVAVAVSGTAALTQLAKNRYDLLVLDLGMPGIGGAAVLDFTIERCLDMAVIVISGTTSVSRSNRRPAPGRHRFPAQTLRPGRAARPASPTPTRKLELERSQSIDVRPRLRVPLNACIASSSTALPDLIFMSGCRGPLQLSSTKRVESSAGLPNRSVDTGNPCWTCSVAPADREKAANCYCADLVDNRQGAPSARSCAFSAGRGFPSRPSDAWIRFMITEVAALADHLEDDEFGIPFYRRLPGGARYH